MVYTKIEFATAVCASDGSGSFCAKAQNYNGQHDPQGRAQLLRKSILELIGKNIPQDSVWIGRVEAVQM